MGASALNQIRITVLPRITVIGGDVMHAMKASDPGYSGFGEAYFSWVEYGAVKAWKQHLRMTMNLVVPLGEVRFVFFSPEPEPSFRHEIIGTSRYARITVPPGIWFGFQGLTRPNSLLLNLADIPHDLAECLRRETNDISFIWDEKLP